MKSNKDKSISFLKNTIYDLREANALTVSELISILKGCDQNAKIFVFDRYEDCDVPLTKEDIYGSEDENEIYFFGEV